MPTINAAMNVDARRSAVMGPTVPMVPVYRHGQRKPNQLDGRIEGLARLPLTCDVRADRTVCKVVPTARFAHETMRLAFCSAGQTRTSKKPTPFAAKTIRCVVLTMSLTHGSVINLERYRASGVVYNDFG